VELAAADLFRTPGREATPGPEASMPESALFGECAGGFLVSAGDEALAALGTHTRVVRIGTVGGRALEISFSGEAPPGVDAPMGVTLKLTMDELCKAHVKLAELFPL
jgi:hypothetical protein